MRAKQSICYRQLRDVQPIVPQITADNYTFNIVKEFIYLGSAVTTKNDVNVEIKRRITLANSCRYGLNGQLSNRDLFRTTKLILLYGTEVDYVHKWRDLQFKIDSEWKFFFVKLFTAISKFPMRGIPRRNTFHISIRSRYLAFGLKRVLTFNKPTHYLIDYGDFEFSYLSAYSLKNSLVRSNRILSAKTLI